MDWPARGAIRHDHRFIRAAQVIEGELSGEEHIATIRAPVLNAWCSPLLGAGLYGIRQAPEGRAVACLAFPYHHDFPAQRLKGRAIAFVALDVASELRTPEIQTGFR